MATDKETHTATREAATRARSAAEEAAHTEETTTRRAADAARSIAEDTAHTGRRAAEEGTETTRKAMGAGVEMTQRGTEAARKMMGTASAAADRSTEQFQRAFGLSSEAQGEVMHQARENMDVMVQCSAVLAEGFQSILREWMGLAQEVASRNADAVNAMLRSRTIPDLYATQSSMLKDNVELMLSRSVKMSEMSARTANDAVAKLSSRTEVAARETRRRF